jgi:hypothetical protein
MNARYGLMPHSLWGTGSAPATRPRSSSLSSKLARLGRPGHRQLAAHDQPPIGELNCAGAELDRLASEDLLVDVGADLRAVGVGQRLHAAMTLEHP